MLDIQKRGEGRLIEKVIYFGDGKEGKVQLRTERGPEMIYGKKNQTVAFPGEYDIEDISVSCFEANKKLSYMFVIKGQRVALLQNAAALEIHSFDGIDVRVCMNQKTREEVENMELEGDIQMLEEGTEAIKEKG